MLPWREERDALHPARREALAAVEELGRPQDDDGLDLHNHGDDVEDHDMADESDSELRACTRRTRRTRSPWAETLSV